MLEEYEWEDFYPMTDNNITVTGLWDPLKTPNMPAGYVMDESKRYLKLVQPLAGPQITQICTDFYR